MKNKNNIIQIVKFTFFSLSAGVIQIGTFTLLNETISWPYWPSYLISLVLSILWNFTLNRKFTFKSAANIPLAMLKVALFYAVFTPVTTVGGNYLDQIGWNEYVILVLTMMLNFVTEFIYTKYYVFKEVNEKAVQEVVSSEEN